MFFVKVVYRSFLLITKSNSFCCGAIGIPGFDPREAAEMALATVRLWLESNHPSIDCVTFCMYENADCEIYEDKCLLFTFLCQNTI